MLVDVRKRAVVVEERRAGCRVVRRIRVNAIVTGSGKTVAELVSREGDVR